MTSTIRSPRGTPPKDARTRRALEVWETEGGARPVSPDVFAVPLVGTASQVEWAERIRSRVTEEFDRVAESFRTIGLKQSSRKRGDTLAILAILEEKRSDVMKREQAGYFIHDWQDITDQVRHMIFRDARYPEIKARIAARHKETIHGKTDYL